MAEPKERRRVTHQHDDEVKTSQEERASSDINRIVAQYQKSGTLPRVGRSRPLYGDFSNPPRDLMELTEMLDQAQDRFEELPSRVRAAADNDYRVFLRMFEDEAGQAELVRAGLQVVPDDQAPPPPQSTPASAPPASPSSTPGGVDSPPSE